MNPSDLIADPAAVEIIDLLSSVRRDVRQFLSALPANGSEAPSRKHVRELERFERTLAHVLESTSSVHPTDRPDLTDNAALLQLRFHLSEEIRHLQDDGPSDPARMRRSVVLLQRFLPQLTDELIHGAPALDPLDSRLVTGLRRLTDVIYYRRFERFYAGRRGRPFLNKFYRDYRPAGVPNTLLLQLDRLAREDPFDHYVCLLTGGLTYAVLLQLLGVPGAKILHVVCGRSSGSQFDRQIRFEPVDFQLDDLAGRRVAIVEHNVATGTTLRTAIESIAGGRPASVGLIVDYVISEVAGLNPNNLADRLDVELSEIHLLGMAMPDGPPLDSDGAPRAAPVRNVDGIKRALVRRLEATSVHGGNDR
jgi:hypothetical protein